MLPPGGLPVPAPRPVRQDVRLGPACARVAPRVTRSDRRARVGADEVAVPSPTNEGRASERVRRLLLHSRTQTAVKAAVAAALAWVLAEGVTQLVADRFAGWDPANYVYYAPMGAVVTSYPTVAASLRNGVSTMVALTLGAAVGLVVQLTLGHGVVALALAIGLGVAVGSVPWAGEQRSWVPVVALFVLVLGDGHTLAYSVAYVGLAGLGTLCGLGVSLLLPALRLTEAKEAVDALRSELVGQLRDSAEALRPDADLSTQDWQDRAHDPMRQVSASRQALQQVLDASRGNPRARYRAETINQLQEDCRALDRVAMLLEDLPGLLADTFGPEAAGPALGPDLAALTAEALDRLADLVAASGAGLALDDERVEHAEEAVQRLTAAFGGRRQADGADVALLGTVVGTLRRALAVFAPVRQPTR